MHVGDPDSMVSISGKFQKVGKRRVGQQGEIGIYAGKIYPGREKIWIQEPPSC